TAVANYMAGSPAIPAYFVSTDNWLLSSGADTADGLHPAAPGYLKMANREKPILAGLIAGASYTITGGSGTIGVGTPTASFTVTLAGGAAFTGDQTITISDGGDGGTITPSVGPPGTSSVIVTPASAAASFTFTYTPASVGIK